MKNKKAIELSVNFLVILIIAIVVFGFGIYLVFKFFGAAPDITEGISSQLQQEINQMLSQGEKVALPINQQTVQDGKGYTFWLGISNMLNNAETNSFTISANLNKFIAPDDTVYTSGTIFNNAKAKLNIIYVLSYVLKNGGQKSIPIAVSVLRGAPSGNYIIDVLVTESGTPYSPLQKLYITVP